MRVNTTIRPCTFDECATILNLWQEAGATPSTTDHIDDLRRLVQDNKALFLVAEHDGQIVGTVLGGWDGWRGNIYRLAVLPEHRRQGLGRVLVQEVERRLAAKGAKKISILVEHEDALAAFFWESLDGIGYRRDHRMVRYAKTL